jgi:proteasome lid subunit RPN8/RPN11
MKPFVLPYSEWRRLYGRAYRAQRRDQSEVCGIVGIDRNRRLSLVFLANASDRPSHFELGDNEIVVARRNLRDAGQRVAGFFHSHPISEAIPGLRDIASSPINCVQLICDVCGRDARLWRICRRGGKRVAVELILEVKRSAK